MTRPCCLPPFLDWDDTPTTRAQTPPVRGWLQLQPIQLKERWGCHEHSLSTDNLELRLRHTHKSSEHLVFEIFGIMRVLSLMMCLPMVVVALRGGYPKKQDLGEGNGQQDHSNRVLKNDHDDKKERDEARKQPREEGADCVNYDTVPSFIINHQLSKQFCDSFEGCAQQGGCCRTYTWLFCDPHNAFSEIPCVCEGSHLLPTTSTAEDDKEELGIPTLPPTSAETTPSFILAVGNGGNTASTATSNATVGDAHSNSTNATTQPIFSTHDEGYFFIQVETNNADADANATLTNATSVWTNETTTPADTTNGFSEAEEQEEAIITAAPTTLAPSTDMPSQSSETTAPSFTASSSSSAVSSGPPTQKPAISPDACMAGSPYNDTGFDNFFACQSSLDCTMLVPVARSARMNAFGSMVVRKKDGRNQDAEEADSLEGGDGGMMISNAQGGAPVQAFCCLASMCLCGVPLGDDWSSKCVPPYFNPGESTTTTTKEPAADETDVPVAASDVPSQRPSLRPSVGPSVSPSVASSTAEPTLEPTMGTSEPTSQAPVTQVPTENVAPEPLSSTEAPTFQVTTEPQPSAVANNPPPPTEFALIESALEAPQPTARTACSDGSWYHDDPNFAGDPNYRACVSSSECDSSRDECCLVDFCFCGRVASGDEDNCV